MVKKKNTEKKEPLKKVQQNKNEIVAEKNTNFHQDGNMYE